MMLRPLVDAAFAQSGQTALHMIGAPFQIKVWEALLRIPSGQVTTYSEIAQSIGNPKAVRAVGTEAVVFFSDIFVPVLGMGVELEFAPGPVIADPIRSAA